MDIIETYLPSFAELSQEDLYACRQRLVDLIETKFSDVDLTPNTVVGDLIVSPLTYTLTSLEKGIDRIFSDLNLGNIATGTIYNCDFAESWLKNFLPDDTLTFPATSVIRLTFSSSEPVVLDRSTQFKIDDTICSLYLPYDGPLYILSPGTTPTTGSNFSRLIDAGSDSYFCDVPVISESMETGLEIESGASADVSIYIETLTSATLQTTLSSSGFEYSLPQLAQMVQKTIYAASMNSRMGVARYVHQMCPFVESVSPILSGESECLRSYHYGTASVSPCMDIYVRSKEYEFTESQKIKLYLTDENKWEGTWDYVGQPYHIEAITSEATPDVLNIPCDIISTNDVGLGPIASYSQYEKLSISIPDALDADGNSIYRPTVVQDSTAESGNKVYAEFVITYQTDTEFKAISDTINSEDNKPINVSVFTRGFIPVIIDSFEVVYVKTPGVTPDLDTAEEDIKVYLGGLGFPNVYSDGEIAKIMQEAGVKYIKDINVEARVQWSVANKIADFDNNIVEVSSNPVINSSDGLRVKYPNTDVDVNTMYSCSTKTIRYYIMENSIKFKEIKEG